MTLPKGGGAIRDIGEKFSVSAATGTASLAVPVATSPGRSGFGPALSLAYDSGSGNGPFGLGWKLSAPAITRKTDRGLPRYTDDPDSDTFLLTGADDLVPVRTERDGRWEQAPRTEQFAGREYRVQAYRPRIEGLFSRIERWRDLGSGETHWRTITSGNVTSWYGTTAASRIADPADPARVFGWLICESYDGTGNAISYEYLAEDGTGVDAARPSEQNRGDLARSANRYLKRIRYGNRSPRQPGHGTGTGTERDWMFEVVFDYGDHRAEFPAPDPDQAWPVRPDPFSTYRPGFEVRTYRRCHRVLMFHHFPAEPEVGADCLVCSTGLGYQSAGGGGMTTLASVTHTGYRRRPGGYHARSLPPVEFCYSRPVIGREVRDLDAAALENLPAGVDGTAYQWVDLDGEGLAGILARQGGAWFYKANLGGGRFAAERMLGTQPALAEGGKQQQLLDLDGSGHLDLADLGGPAPGFYERTGEQGWRAFRPFRSWPNISLTDPDLRLVDLDGDGLADVLITGDDAVTWYPSLRHEGFGPARRTCHPWGEDHGPRVVLADPEQTIHLADMTGDGLTDLVRVRNGEICYWPNTGFGRFGAKVTMDGSPWLDEPGLFDQRRVRLADVDGSGAMDLVYLGRDEARVYLNQSGNGFGAPHGLGRGFPAADGLASVSVTDLLGTGTACLAWSSPLPADAGRQVRYLELMTEGKPYLLTGVVNNLGAQTRIGYAPSTRFYLQDQAAGRPWITRLPFPVQVVERVDTIDAINRTRFTTRYAYHHGYFDGFEREFRGFGMVETYDTEQLAVLEPGQGGHVNHDQAGDSGRSGFANLDPATDVPPVLTRTWLHTGTFPGEGRVSRHFADEFYRPPGADGPELPDTTLPDTLRPAGGPRRPWRLTSTEAREACRALKGAPLREEVYALDGSQAQGRPYTVTEHNYTIELLQPALDPRPDGPQNYHAVFLTHPRETVAAHYDRMLYPAGPEWSDPAGTGMRADPRIGHDVVLEADDYGNTLRSVSVAYGRARPDPALGAGDQAAQHRMRITGTENSYTNAVDRTGAHRTPMPSQTRVFEITGLAPRGALFGFAELRDGLAAIETELPYQDWDAGSRAPARRLIAHTRVRYRRDDLAGPLPPGVLEPLALPYRSYRLALTGSLLGDLYEGRVSHEMLAQAGYASDDGTWWIPSAEVFYSPGAGDGHAAEAAFARQHFFLPRRFRDPYGNTTTASYDDYDLLVCQTADPLGNLITAGERDPSDQITALALDYRTLEPGLVSDPNRNRVAVCFDTLGRVAGTAVMGKPEERLGDGLDGFDPDPDQGAVEAHFADPFAHAHTLLGAATTRLLYDTGAYQRSRHTGRPQPAGIAILARVTHVSDLAEGERTDLQRSFSYSDGFGREVQRKAQAAPGPVTDDGPEVAHRWIGSGWTVYNNKGNPVRTYEPFFTRSPGFEFARAAGVSAVVFYDPPGRVIATLHPDDSYEKTVFHPWGQQFWDVNDTVLLDPRHDPDVRGYTGRYLAGLAAQPGGWATWYARRIGGELGLAQQRAAEKTATHAGTPALNWFDPIGRVFLTVTHNRFCRDGRLTEEFYRTHSDLDIQGNLRQVRDPLGRVAMRYGYTVAGGQVTHAGMDTGGGGLLPDVTGAPALSWTARGFTFRTDYDELRRAVRGYVSGPGLAGEVLQLRTVYGDAMPGQPAIQAAARNLRTRIVMQYDSAGLATNDGYDFKGNLVKSKHQMASGYRELTDWNEPAGLDERSYRSRAGYDALNRLTTMTTPDGSVTIPGYNATGLLDRIGVRLRGDAATTTFVAHLDYNARGQRTAAHYGNGTRSRYRYDPATFRLARLTTTHDRVRLQDLSYTYDPVGNPTLIRDDAQERVFFRNQVADPSARYTYDATYRLIEATGREHLGQGAGGAPRPAAPGAARPVPPGPGSQPPVALPQPGDGTALARYTEHYSYDAAGNLRRMAHRSADPACGGWTRDWRYREPSLLEPGVTGNRLSWSGPADEVREHRRFRYDEQGNTIAMPELPALGWDPQDRMHRVAKSGAAKSGGGPGAGATYYVYDAAGQRARKVTDRAPASGSPQAQRMYLGGYEVYREYAADGTVAVERETLHVSDDLRRVALVETRTRGSDAGAGRLIRYQLPDHLGSSVLELDQRARVISYEEYYPYGSTSFQAVRAQTQTPKRYRFTGKEHDAETGLYYHGARYYIPWLGRWASCDPGGLRDGPNLYLYARDNPVSHRDPDGREARLIIDPGTHTATVQSTIHIYGVSSANLRAIQAVTKQAEAAWASPVVATQADVEAAQKANTPIPNAGLSAKIGGTQWTLKFDVHYQIHSGVQPPVAVSAPVNGQQNSIYDVNTQRATADKFAVGDNAITMKPAAPGNIGGVVQNLSTGSFTTNMVGEVQGPWQTASDQAALARRLVHETGHAIGFDERYDPVTASFARGGYPGFDFDFMGSDNGYPTRVLDPIHVTEYLTFAAALLAKAAPTANSAQTFLLSGHIDDTHGGRLVTASKNYPGAQATAVTGAVARAQSNTAAWQQAQAKPSGTGTDVAPHVPSGLIQTIQPAQQTQQPAQPAKRHP